MSRQRAIEVFVTVVTRGVLRSRRMRSADRLWPSPEIERPRVIIGAQHRIEFP
jgi:hypothetical protein